MKDLFDDYDFNMDEPVNIMSCYKKPMIFHIYR